MALADRQALLLEDGVMFLEDPEIGNRVYEFSQMRFPFQTEAGLDFCRINTLEDTASNVKRLYENIIDDISVYET